MTENINGHLTNMDSGEVFSGDFCLFPNDFQLETIMKIMVVNDYVHPDSSMQVSVDGLGLDCVGGVFQVNLEYTPRTVEERDKLLQDLKVRRILSMKGRYGMTDGEVTIYDAVYRSVEPYDSEEELQEVFRINGKEWEKRFTVVK